MSATDQMRAMIAELMGTSALDDTTARPKHKYTDRAVCRAYLLGCCPYDLLATTARRSSHFLVRSFLLTQHLHFMSLLLQSLFKHQAIGDCRLVHDVALRSDYEREQQKRDHFYDLDVLQVLEPFIEDTDRKIEIARKQQEEKDAMELNEEAKEAVHFLRMCTCRMCNMWQANKLLTLNEDLGKKLAEAERLAEEDEKEASEELMKEVAELNTQKHELEVRLTVIARKRSAYSCRSSIARKCMAYRQT